MNNRIAAFLTFAFTMLVACVAFAQDPAQPAVPGSLQTSTGGIFSYLALGAGLAIGIAAAGGGIGQGRAAAAALEDTPTTLRAEWCVPPRALAPTTQPG